MRLPLSSLYCLTVTSDEDTGPDTPYEPIDAATLLAMEHNKDDTYFLSSPSEQARYRSGYPYVMIVHADST